MSGWQSATLARRSIAAYICGRRGCGVRQEISTPGAYRSKRELFLDGPVGSFIWRPPTV